MATIGERLTEARKNIGLDIRSAAEATKIRRDFLAALEENQPEKINLADVYKIGFMRIYASYLKLDNVDRIVAEFRTTLSIARTNGKGSHRGIPLTGTPAGKTSDGSEDSGSSRERSGLFIGDSSRGRSPFSAAGKKQLLIAAGAVVAAIVIIVGLVMAFSGDESADASASATAAAGNADEAQVYEFEIRSKIPQRITITDRYDEPTNVRAVVIDEAIPANRPRILRGRGILEIRDSVGGNLEIRFPSVKALRAAPAGKVVSFENSEKSDVLTSSATYWVADPLAAPAQN